MMLKHLRWVVGMLASFPMGCVAAVAAEPAIIAKARAYLGSEDALNALTSVHYKGSIQDEKDGRLTVEIIFRKPFRHRMVITGPKAVEITALDDYEAWRRVQDAKDPSGWRLNLLRPDQVKRLRANTFEALSFFRGLEGFGGRIEEMGEVQVDGKPLLKIAFRHPNDITFFRFFDPESGRLVRTETDQGVISEEGEIVAGGLRFPKRIITKNKQVDGSYAMVTIEFESVVINEEMAQSLFAVPPLR